MIAKLVSGNLVQCRKYGRDGSGRVHTDLPSYYAAHLDEAAVDGYYPVRFTERPEGDYKAIYELIDGEIVQGWEEFTPEPEPADPVEERLDMLEECILEMSEIVYA